MYIYMPNTAEVAVASLLNTVDVTTILFGGGI
jgi:hypothetical protein